MVSIKTELIKVLKDVIEYPVVSIYPKDRIVPVCIIQETSNLSIMHRENTSEVVYRFNLYDTNKTKLNEEFNKLDSYMMNLGFERYIFEENDSELIHSLVVSYQGVIRLEGDTVRVYKLEY